MDKRAATGIRFLIVSLLLALVAACGGGGGGKSAVVVSIAVEPVNSTVARGLTRELTATATLSNGATTDVTSTATWTSSANAIARVSGTGVVTGVAVGAADIRASFDGVQSNAARVTVTAAVITAVQVTPATPSVGLGSKPQFTATATLSDSTNSDVTASAAWVSSDLTVATVSDTAPTKGLATTLKVGSTDITATVSGIRGTTTLTVTAAAAREIQITPAAPSVAKGLTQQLTATLVFTDNSTQDVTATATWTSSAPAIATVSDAAPTKGLAKGIAAGTVTVTAVASGKTGSTQLTVSNAALQSIELKPAAPTTLPKGGYTQQFTATGKFSDGTTPDITTQVLWVSTDAAPDADPATALAPVSNAAGSKGLVTSGAVAGTARITATLNDIVSPATTLTVSDDVLSSIAIEPANSSIALGQSQQFKATGMFGAAGPTRDVTLLATWASDDETVATISNAEGSKGLSVSQSAGGPVAITASLKNSANTVITGTTNITVTNAALVSIAVSPIAETLPKTYTRDFRAIGTYSDGSVADITTATKTTWTSSDSNRATISNAVGSKGVARGGSAGSTTISAIQDGVTGSTSLAVTDATLVSISVDPDTVVLAQGLTQQFKATGTFSDAFEMDITSQVSWSSSDSNVASISNSASTRGVATAKAQSVNPITITATKGAPPDAITGTASLSVPAADIVDLAVFQEAVACSSPLTNADPDTFIPKMFSAGFRACASYTDGVVRDVTAVVVWSTAAPGVATVANDAPNKGVATAVAEGRTVVRATLGDQDDSIPVEVTAATLNTIAVTPAGQTMANDSAPIQFDATGTFSDAKTLRITRHVTWTSSSDSVEISNAAGTQGLASPGSDVLFGADVTITATRGSKKGEVALRRAP